VARTLRWLVAAMIAVTVFLLVWYGLAIGWHWSRGDALGLAAAALALVLTPLGWWAALPIDPADNKDGVVGKAEDRSGPGSPSHPVRFGAIPAVLSAVEPREDLLSLLRASSGADQVTAVCAVTGLRGVGKTQLVAEMSGIGLVRAGRLSHGSMLKNLSKWSDNLWHWQTGSRGRPQDDGAPGVADELSRPGSVSFSLRPPDY
jgi:hypothetical protein